MPRSGKARGDKGECGESEQRDRRIDGGAEQARLARRGEYQAVTDSLEPSLGGRLIGYLDSQKNFLLEHDFIRNDFYIRDFVDREPLKAVKAIVDAEAIHSQVA